MKQLLLDIQLPHTPTLDNFVAGRNQEALHSLSLLAKGASSARCIYLWGPSGSGKSHLLQAVAQQASDHAVPLLTADDVDKWDAHAQIALFNQYNRMLESGGVLVAAGNAAPAHMQLRDDLATRLAWGLVYQLHPLSDDETATALKLHAQARGMQLPEGVIDYCQRYLRRDLPHLLAVLDALDQWSLTMQRPVTLPLLRDLLTQVAVTAIQPSGEPDG